MLRGNAVTEQRFARALGVGPLSGSLAVSVGILVLGEGHSGSSVLFLKAACEFVVLSK